jgi:enterochelin esterase-like enzyme
MNKFLLMVLGVCLVGCASAPPSDPKLTREPKSISDASRHIAWTTPRVDAPRVQYRVFQSAAARADVSYHVYVPSAYDQQPGARFPVLYWLHGTGGGNRGIAPISRHFDEAIRAGKIAPMLVVFVNGLPEGMWCDSADGTAPVETVFIREVIPHVDANFWTHSARAGRILEGFSMGGYGAARLGMRYHDTFAAVSMLAGGPLDPDFMGPRATSNPAERTRILGNVYGGGEGGNLGNFREQSPWTIAEQMADKVRATLKLRVVIGDRDFTYAANRQFSAHLSRLNVPHQFVELAGVPHDTMALFTALGQDNWLFYRNALTAK